MRDGFERGITGSLEELLQLIYSLKTVYVTQKESLKTVVILCGPIKYNILLNKNVIRRDVIVNGDEIGKIIVYEVRNLFSVIHRVEDVHQASGGFV